MQYGLLLNLSTTIYILLYVMLVIGLFDFDSFVMKSIVIDFYSCLGFSICYTAIFLF